MTSDITPVIFTESLIIGRMAETSFSIDFYEIPPGSPLSIQESEQEELEPPDHSDTRDTEEEVRHPTPQAVSEEEDDDDEEVPTIEEDNSCNKVKKQQKHQIS